MNIKKSELVQIIKEEAIKVKKVKLLEAEKNEIIKQLNEMYEGEEMEEGWFGSSGVDKKKALEIINAHPAKRAVYKQALDRFPERAPKYVEFFMKNPKVKSVKWDEAKQQYVDAMGYSNLGGASGMAEAEI